MPNWHTADLATMAAANLILLSGNKGTVTMAIRSCVAQNTRTICAMLMGSHLHQHMQKKEFKVQPTNAWACFVDIGNLHHGRVHNNQCIYCSTLQCVVYAKHPWWTRNN
jgi:hypothetical protein